MSVGIAFARIVNTNINAHTIINKNFCKLFCLCNLTFTADLNRQCYNKLSC